ncbi:DUF222 domain-containing protein [Pseudactinotalea sp. Z1748]|uniref:HNH endonuclease signature motif containing protein n=1 Tax=Pseudactinotalea sp. Z1748 TaxID=3413027 RepID=UPI003C7A3FA5
MSTTSASSPGYSVPGRGPAAREAAARYLGAPLTGWERFKRLKTYLDAAPDEPGVLIEMAAACAQLRSNIDGIESEILQALLQVPSRSGWGEEIAARMALSTRAAEGRLDRAAALDQYSEVHFALLGGEIDLPKARVFLDAVKTLPPGQGRAIHRTILPDAPGLTVGQLRHRLQAAALAVDADNAQARHEEAVKDRYVRAEPAEDGMAYLTFYLPAVDAAAAMSVLDALAVKDGPEDERPIAARRVDAFMAIIRQILSSGTTPDGQEVPTQHRKRPQMVFTVAQSTLDGHDDAPGYLAGHGPLSADIIRHLVGTVEVTSQVLPTDPVDGTAQPPPAAAQHTTGERAAQRRAAPERVPSRPGVHDDPAAALAAMGVLACDSYQPGATLREFILARDVTCRFPTCRQPGRRCQIDHIVPFTFDRPAWAQTHQGNLHLLCARHHGLKTAGAWRITREPATGDTRWTSPLGYTYTRAAQVVDPAHELPVLHRQLQTMRVEHADQPELFTGSAPLSPGVVSEVEWARAKCRTPAHARPGACDCAERAEDITTILAGLQPPDPPDRPDPTGSAGSANHHDVPGSPDLPGPPASLDLPAEPPATSDPGEFPTSTDPPPF